MDAIIGLTALSGSVHDVWITAIAYRIFRISNPISSPSSVAVNTVSAQRLLRMIHFLK